MPEVLIAGGGPAGLAAAIALAERGVPVTVVDPAAGAARARAELLAEGARPIMERLGLGPALASFHRVRDIQSTWGAAHLQAHGLMPGLGRHGWGVDRLALSKAMGARAKALGVRITAATVKATERVGARWQAHLSAPGGPQAIRTDFIIDATGRTAGIARRHGAVARHGPDLIAAIWRVQALQTATMQAEAAPDGWWYAVPLAQGATIGFVGDASAVKRAAADAVAYAARWDTSLARVAAQTRADPQLVDCRSAILDRTCGPGWLATGDAACAFDPISSQGLFNALSSGFFAGQAAADALEGDRDAPLVFEALVKRTAEHTHARTHLQYAALPFDTPFWRHRARGGHKKPAMREIPA